MPIGRQRILCQKVPAFTLDDWTAIDALFAHASFAHFQQGWSETPSPGFRPAKAAAAWTDTHIAVYAELCDDDIFNPVPESAFNTPAFLMGDVFEIFLKPGGQDPYFEFHVSPTNQKLQLRLPRPHPFDALRARFRGDDGAMLDSLKIPLPSFESRIRLAPGARIWWVAAAIPFGMMADGGRAPAAGDEWLFSFSRYDYTRPCPIPTYSSTSPHSRVNYHDLDDYGTLVFA